MRWGVGSESHQRPGACGLETRQLKCPQEDVEMHFFLHPFNEILCSQLDENGGKLSSKPVWAERGTDPTHPSCPAVHVRCPHSAEEVWPLS